MENALAKFIARRAASRHATFVVATSGGVDSMALLECARRALRPERLVVAHYHHGVRGAGADAAEALVRVTAERFALRYATQRRASGGASEAELRRDRRAFLRAVRARYAADFVLLAHHADDQLETMLMRLLRGTGMDGLGAMRPRSGIWLRPFLATSRAQIEAYVREHQIPFLHDETNTSDRYLRGRVRKILPSLYELATPYGGSETFLARVGETLTDVRWAARETRRAAGEKHFPSLVVTRWWARLSLVDIAKATLAWRRQGIRLALREIGALVPSREAMAALLVFAKRDRGRMQIEGAEVEISCGYVYFRSAAQRKLAAPDLAELGLEITGYDPALELRLATPGDRLRSTKLKKIWLERRVPRPERASMPVLVRAGSRDVQWFLGLDDAAIAVRRCDFPFANGASNRCTEIS